MYTYTYIHTYIYIYIHGHAYVCIHTYRERERERDIYIYIYRYITFTFMMQTYPYGHLLQETESANLPRKAAWKRKRLGSESNLGWKVGLSCLGLGPVGFRVP